LIFYDKHLCFSSRLKFKGNSKYDGYNFKHNLVKTKFRCSQSEIYKLFLLQFFITKICSHINCVSGLVLTDTVQSIWKLCGHYVENILSSQRRKAWFTCWETSKNTQNIRFIQMPNKVVKRVMYKMWCFWQLR
jgi:hypothetical protein